MADIKFTTLAEVSEALQAEFAKADKADLAVIQELNDLAIEFAKAEPSEAQAEAVAELEAEVASLKGKASDPQEARLAAINEGKTMKIVVDLSEEDGKQDLHELELRFTVKSFSVPGFGDLKSAAVVARPEHYGAAIQKLLSIGSKVIQEVNRKKVKSEKK